MRMFQRPFHATPPWRFGRKAQAVAVTATEPPAASLLDDLRLFLLTFGGGFLFVTIYLA